MPAPLNLTNQRFGRLVAKRPVGLQHSFVLWLCVCDCGQETQLTTNALRRGNTRSCGCMLRELYASGGSQLRHGAARPGKHTVEYGTWQAIIKRCSNPNHERFQYYGGRGIRVCERWQTFENFLADMGPRPSGRYSIERLDVNGNYEPDNCVWIPLADQVKNRRPRQTIR